MHLRQTYTAVRRALEDRELEQRRATEERERAERDEAGTCMRACVCADSYAHALGTCIYAYV